jgi:hypothetical protein
MHFLQNGGREEILVMIFWPWSDTSHQVFLDRCLEAFLTFSREYELVLILLSIPLLF